ncbi:sensor histidine kinase [Allomuricauda sp. SCSIO 65647]|uniref:sensor histidine kinase n=1 Tax=Allomuricauda sp. SCSIO 65647 TaxID=2908843 RepID=UPI001F2E8DCF|nr:histidine kinase [Muricauda sp. SCSIO 65647]UJH67330.1 histidine kinase [Muricauda sp. SCSIO 65647]
MWKHLAIATVGFLLGISLHGFLSFNTDEILLEHYLSGVLGILIGYAIFYSNSFLNRLWPWRKHPGLRLFVGLIFDLLLSFFLVFLSIWLYMAIMKSPMGTFDFQKLLIKIGILLFCVSLVYNIFYFAFYSYNHYAAGQLMELKLERRQAELQLTTLKSQLSPHFLFNSINSLSSLFQKDVVKAELFIRALAKSYDYVLKNHRASLVTVGDELQFVEAYAQLMKTRFAEGFELQVDLSESVRKSKIPPLTLQILVENALKHNVMDSNHSLSVKIDADKNHIQVKNNKTRPKQQLRSTKIGLKNIASRYRLLNQNGIEVFDKEHFTVKLPILI